MIDETTAKTKWCPMIQVSGMSAEDVADNRGEGDSEPKTCIGSDCMIWKWGIFIGEWANIGYCGLTK